MRRRDFIVGLGLTVLPGLIDTHAHMEDAGAAEFRVPPGRSPSPGNGFAAATGGPYRN